MVDLSVVIITLNEEKNIARCIDSVKDVADEVLVVDSFSTDKTEEIAISKGAKFIKNKFEGYVEQQVFALNKASHDYVLTIDADEALSPESQKQVLEIKKNWKHDAYSFNRLTNFCGQWIRHCGWYPDKKVRLVDRRKVTWGGENPHYKFVIPESSEVGHIHGDILHYSFPTITSHTLTANNFSEVAAKAAHKKGKKINFIVHILLNPFFTFVKKYFFQLGFLDGFYGFFICVSSAYANFLKYVKIWELQRENSNL